MYLVASGGRGLSLKLERSQNKNPDIAGVELIAQPAGTFFAGAVKTQDDWEAIRKDVTKVPAVDGYYLDPTVLQNLKEHFNAAKLKSKVVGRVVGGLAVKKSSFDSSLRLGALSSLLGVV